MEAPALTQADPTHWELAPTAPGRTERRRVRLICSVVMTDVPADPGGRPQAAQHLAFGPYVINLTSLQLERYGARVGLAPQAARLLTYLIQHRDRVVTRDELREQLRSGRDVEPDQGLDQAIGQIRKALADDAASPHFIVTVPGEGYRFIADLRPERYPGVPGKPLQLLAAVVAVAVAVVAGIAVLYGSRTLTLPTSGGSVDSSRAMLVVLPFIDVGGPTEASHFSDGFTEALISRLTLMGPEWLGVIPNASSRQYKDTNKSLPAIAAELGVRYLLQGSVQYEGDRVRVTAELIDGTSGWQLWAEAYESPMSDIFRIQGDIARSVTASIH